MSQSPMQTLPLDRRGHPSLSQSQRSETTIELNVSDIEILAYGPRATFGGGRAVGLQPPSTFPFMPWNALQGDLWSFAREHRLITRIGIAAGLVVTAALLALALARPVWVGAVSRPITEVATSGGR